MAPMSLLVCEILSIDDSRIMLTRCMSIEVVGLSPALKMGFDLLRPWGVLSSVGVHNGEVPRTPKALTFDIDMALDPLDRQPSIWQEFENPNGSLSCPIHLSRSS